MAVLATVAASPPPTARLYCPASHLPASRHIFASLYSRRCIATGPFFQRTVASGRLTAIRAVAETDKGEERCTSPSPPSSSTSSKEFRKILLSDVVVKGRRRVYWGRKWNYLDIATASVVLTMHVLCLFAPFTFTWPAFWTALSLYFVTGLLGITLSFHRNLSHRSFKLPKWLEYSFAYCGVQALQCGEPSNVGDLEKQPFYRFMRSTYVAHPITLALLLYASGGFPFIVWGMGVRIVWVYHITWLVNSACHVWGHQSWNTRDLSRNNWWVALLAFGEGWHNNHHAFEFSARHGLEWWQLDFTWYVVWLLQAIGLATDVKIPSQAQKRRMSLNAETSTM